jgi:hypothetical protein
MNNSKIQNVTIAAFIFTVCVATNTTFAAPINIINQFQDCSYFKGSADRDVDRDACGLNKPLSRGPCLSIFACDSMDIHPDECGHSSGCIHNDIHNNHNRPLKIMF